MASLRTAALTTEAQSIVRVFKISSCVTGDTLAVPQNKGTWIANVSTTDAATHSYSATTGLVTVTVANTPDILVFVLL